MLSIPIFIRLTAFKVMSTLWTSETGDRFSLVQSMGKRFIITNKSYKRIQMLKGCAKKHEGNLIVNVNKVFLKDKMRIDHE